MLEECIDVNKARQHQYVINPSFSPELKELSDLSAGVMSEIEQLRQEVVDDLGLTKEVKLATNQTYTYVFEIDKKEGDNGMRSSRENYKTVSCKMRIMAITCNRLKKLVEKYNHYESEYYERQAELEQKVIEITASYYPLLESISTLIAKMDVCTAFA